MSVSLFQSIFCGANMDPSRSNSKHDLLELHDLRMWQYVMKETNYSKLIQLLTFNFALTMLTELYKSCLQFPIIQCFRGILPSVASSYPRACVCMTRALINLCAKVLIIIPLYRPLWDFRDQSSPPHIFVFLVTSVKSPLVDMLICLLNVINTYTSILLKHLQTP